MSYETQNLSVLAYANNFTLWHYVTSDQSIETENYFSHAGNGMFRANDMIIANINTDGAPVTKFYIVTENSKDTVKISAMG